MSKKQIWIVVDHPQQLATALGVVSYWNRQKYAFNLLISPHPYWKRVKIDLYRHKFDKVVFLERPDYTWHPLYVLREILQIWRLKRRIAELHIDRGDIIIGLSVFHYVENIILSMYPDNYKVSIIPYVVYQECTADMDKRIYRGTLEGWLASWLVEPLTGLHRTYCMKERLHPDTYWRLRYKESLTDIYSKVVVMGIFTETEREPSNNVVTMPFPYLLALGDGEGNSNQPRKVVFFGTNIRSGMWGIKPETYNYYLNLCLSFLRKEYGSTHKLVYRPHPAEGGLSLLSLDGFEIENDGVMAELYLCQNIDDIHAVFSSESTSSRSGFDSFINSYVFFDIFPYEESVKEYFRQAYGNVPSDFYITDLFRTPNRYIKTGDVGKAIKKCQQVLGEVLSVKELHNA